ncbi:MAG TPA: glycosyltransferase, partial [Phormidium sp.]
NNIRTTDRLLKTSEVLAKFDNAFAVAIPLDLPSHKPYNTVGLSSLLEAMCMGRAVIATENKDMAFDLEREGVGFTVPYKDVLAWRQAVQYLLDHPEEAQEMGLRGRFLAEKKYNLTNFTQKIVQCMHSLVQ